MTRRDVVLLLIVAALVVVPLTIVGPRAGSGFQGADSRAQDLVSRIAPGYEPWFKPLWTPPSGEVASLLFAVQAGVGCAFLGYYFGVRVGAKRAREEAERT